MTMVTDPVAVAQVLAVTGGVDTHAEVHVAAAIDAVGRELGHASFATTPAGYAALLAWLDSFGPLERVGVEGTGVYGAGLTRVLQTAGVTVVEVDRPDRKARRYQGKSDPIDAYAAARAALSGRASGTPKTRTGTVEMIRTLRVARAGAVKAKTVARNQLKALIKTAPAELRERLRHLDGAALLDACVSLRAARGPASISPSGPRYHWETRLLTPRKRTTSFDTLLHLVAHGVYLDRDRRHTDLWVWVLDQLLRARRRPQSPFMKWFDNLQHYPALLAMRTIAAAAIAAGREDVLLHVLRTPTWSSPFDAVEMPAFAALHDYYVLDHEVVKSLPRWSTEWSFPRSRLLRETLEPVLKPLVGDPDSYRELCDRTEYRIALLQHLADPHGPAPGEFIGERRWDREGLIPEADFRVHGDRSAWVQAGLLENGGDAFEVAVTSLAETLKPRRHWG